VTGPWQTIQVIQTSTRIRPFTTSNVTTYGGGHGSILGRWATSQLIDTTNGTPAAAVVANASVLSNGGQDFSIWLRCPPSVTSRYAGSAC